MSVPPLLCDAMLGELARWLRLRGYDTLFMPDTPDIDIVRRARYEGRVVLTQDVPLAQHPAIEALVVESDNLKDQLIQIAEILGLPGDDMLPRCAICNSPLEVIMRAQAKPYVPPYVFRTVEVFSQCTGCKRVYWRGTHWEGIEERLEDE